MARRAQKIAELQTEERAREHVDEQRCLELGLVAAPGLPADVTASILSELASELDHRFRSARWGSFRMISARWPRQWQIVVG